MIAKIFVEIVKLIRDIIKVLCLFAVAGVLIGIVLIIDPWHTL